MLDENLSALLDGELDAAEAQRLLERIRRDPVLRAAWTRQHLLRAALRGGLSRSRLDVAESVSEQLQAEAVTSKVVDLTHRLRVAAPVATESTVVRAVLQAGRDPVSPASLVVPTEKIGTLPSRRRTAVFGMALAASVAAVAVLIPVWGLLGNSQSVSVATNVSQDRLAWSGVDDDTARELNGYLLEHHNAAEYTLAAVPGSARLATGLQDAAYRH